MNTYPQILNKIAVKYNIENDKDFSRYEAGFHHTYDLGDKYIVKMEDSSAGTLNHHKKFLDLLSTKGAKVSKVVEFGEENGKSYLVLEKIPGRSLSNDWLDMSDEQRERIIEELAKQLKIFHSVKFGNYIIPALVSNTPSINLREAVKNSTKFNLINKNVLKPEFLKEFEYLENFYQQHEYILDEQDTAVFVFNDIHLENIIWDGKELTGIIDFDWVCQAPKDYELWKIIDVTREPRFTVDGELKPLVEGYQMTKEFAHLKKHYSELFETKDLPNRIRLFYIQELINNRFLDYQKGLISEKTFRRVISEINDIFRSDWLDKLLT